MDKRPILNRAPSQLAESNYWAKNGLNTCQASPLDCAGNLVNSHPGQEHCLQPLAVENHQLAPPPRFEPQNRPMSGLTPINGRNSDDLVYGLEPKNGNSTSAFSPLQSGGVRMSYFSYESFNFPHKHSSGMEAKKSMEVTTKGGHASFPNQLIALNQIRNYASMPSSVSLTAAEHPISLKD